MLHFGMELRGVDFAFGAFHCRYGAHVGRSRHGKAGGYFGNGVAVAHPYRLGRWRFCEQSAPVHMQLRCAIFAHFRMANGAAQRYGRDLVPVAKAQHRQAQIENGRVDARRVFGVHACGAAGKDDCCRRHLAHFIGRDIARHDFGIHIQIAHAASNKLAILRAEIEYENLLA